MDILLSFANQIFWYGLCGIIIAATCDLFFGSPRRTLRLEKILYFPKHMDLQKLCRFFLGTAGFCIVFAKFGPKFGVKPTTPQVLISLIVTAIYFCTYLVTVTVLYWIRRLYRWIHIKKPKK